MSLILLNDHIAQKGVPKECDKPPELSGALHYPPYTISDIVHALLPDLSRFDRSLVKSTLIFLRERLLSISGLENIPAAKDPFILIANHNQRLEALLLPLWLAYHRQGKLIHFMADWNFRLVPIISMFLRRGQTIPVITKPARPKFLNVFKPFIIGETHGYDLARQRLREGKSIGIFPEGTINPDPRNLLRGHLGAAKLSLETGAPLVPLGIRFPFHDHSRPIPALAKFEIEIGSPIYPPEAAAQTIFSQNDIRSMHSVMMQHLASLSHKHWNPLSSRRTHHDDRENP